MTPRSQVTRADKVAWHSLDAAAIVSAVGTDVEKGLTPAQADSSRAKHGENALPETPPRSLMSVFLHQFKNPLIYLLFGAAGVALAMREVSDAIVIFVVVMLNAFIGAYQEGRAERALAALRKLAEHPARVVRDGREDVIDARLLVPGDIVLLAAGDAVPADARVLDAASLQVAEAALTGESLPILKDAVAVKADTSLGDRVGMVYAGTHVTAGRGRAVVVATGQGTEIGHIASLAGNAVAPKTPLERRIDQFGRTLTFAAFGLFALIMAIGTFRDVPLPQLVMLGVSQIVGMIPEGLPVAMTIALAVGVQRMAARNAVVRRLSAVETLGSTTVICSDKTGTLTRNEMTVTQLFLPEHGAILVSGIGYASEGEFSRDGAKVAPQQEPALLEILEASLLCNDARIVPGDGPDSAPKALGDPTEAALVSLGLKAGIDLAALKARQPRTAELPFDAATKLMATQHAAKGVPFVILKGAPELLVGLCATVRQGAATAALDDAAKSRIKDAGEHMAEGALRVLAVAVVEGAVIDVAKGFEAFKGRATFLGLVGQIDPPRAEVADAVKQCQAAGIRPVMVTGDHKATGLAVARSLGIAHDGDLALDGAELEALSPEALADCIDRVSVFARVHPEQKLRIVDAYQKRRHVVAMTGDGVNDAPALVKADVGVAMGRSGTEVAKEAAKIVIADDNFASIVAAVEEGRVVYGNIKKAVLFLFATSLAEVAVLLGALILGYPPPFAAVQILWNNLVTEGVITVNLIMDPPEGDEMKRPPIPPGEALITGALLRRLLVMTPTITAVSLGWYVARLSAGVSQAQAQTEAFTLLAICEWFNVLNCRSSTHSALDASLFKNRWLVGGLLVGNVLQAAVVYAPPLNRVFHTVPLDAMTVIALGAVGSVVLWTEEVRKFFARRQVAARGKVP